MVVNRLVVNRLVQLHSKKCVFKTKIPTLKFVLGIYLGCSLSVKTKWRCSRGCAPTDIFWKTRFIKYTTRPNMKRAVVRNYFPVAEVRKFCNVEKVFDHK